MLQDIAPHIYDNTFAPYAIEEGDYTVTIEKRRIYLYEEEGRALFPVYREGDKEDYLYLFSVDEKRFFLDLKRRIPEGTKACTFHELQHLSPRHLVYGACVAIQLGSWYSDNVYCGRCGKKNVFDTKERMLTCPDCHTAIYPRINPCVITGVIHDDEIIMTQSLGWEKKHFGLVAGFAEIGESIEDCVRREVFEEVGLHVRDLTFYKSQPWPQSDSLLFGFFCRLDGDSSIHRQESELAQALWVHRKEIPEGRDQNSLTGEMIEYFRTHENKEIFG